jgi:hypothetical protein
MRVKHLVAGGTLFARDDHHETAPLTGLYACHSAHGGDDYAGLGPAVDVDASVTASSDP